MSLVPDPVLFVSSAPRLTYNISNYHRPYVTYNKTHNTLHILHPLLHDTSRIIFIPSQPAHFLELLGIRLRVHDRGLEAANLRFQLQLPFLRNGKVLAERLPLGRNILYKLSQSITAEIDRQKTRNRRVNSHARAREWFGRG